MSTHLWDVFLLLSIYLALAAACFGWGRMTADLLGIGGQEVRMVTASVWLGWAAILFIFQVAHLLLPMTVYVAAPIFVFGMVFAAPAMVSACRRRSFQSSAGTILSFAVLIVLGLAVTYWVASRAMLHPENYDSGLYHFNSIRWINSFAIVPGLGNLHGRLAFNQSFFTYVAALNLHPFFGHGRVVANSFLFLLTFATCIDLLRPMIRRPRLLLEAHAFRYALPLFILPILAYLALSSTGIASPTPDLASILLQLVIFMFFANSLCAWREEPVPSHYYAIFLIILSATAIKVKLSNIAFAVTVIAFVLASRCSLPVACVRSVVRSLAPAVLILVVWCLRGYLLSGAPLYPSTVGYIPFDWAVPRESMTVEARWVYSWARMPGGNPDEILGNWRWLAPWFERITKNIVEVTYPIVVAAVYLCAGMSMLFFRRRGGFEKLDLVVLLPPIAGLAFWFFTAPSPRFAIAVLLTMPIAAGVVLLEIVRKQSEFKTYLTVLTAMLVIGNAGYAWYFAGASRNFLYVSTSGVVGIQQVPLARNVTAQGLNVYSPMLNDQCWDAPLPCTPYDPEKVRLRDPARGGMAGFIWSGTAQK